MSQVMSAAPAQDKHSRDAPGEVAHSVILKCLARVRWRLWGVRVMERAALALAWGGALGAVFTVARLLRDRYPAWAMAVALLPIAAAVWVWIKFNHQRKGTTNGRGIITPAMARTAAVLTAVLSTAMLVLVFASAGVRVPVWAIPLATVAIFTSAAIASVRMIDWQMAAIFVDRQVGLKERVATALELLEQPAATEWEAAFREPVITSALAACAQAQSAKVGYHRLDRRVYAVATTLLLATMAVSTLTPLPPLVRTTRKPSPIVVTQVRKMEEVLKELEEKKLPIDKVTAEKLKPLDKAIAELKTGNMSPIETSALMNEVKEQLKSESDSMAASEKVQQMLSEMKDMQDFARAGDPLKDANLKDAGGDAAAAAQRQAAREKMDAAAQAMANKMNNGQMSDSEKKTLTEDLKAAAKAASADPQLQKDLQNAASAAEGGDANQLSSSMQSAGQRMGQQRADRQASQDSINRAMAEIDRMSGNGSGQQSTMAQAGQQGDGQQGNGQQKGSGQNGDQQSANGQNGQNGQSGGQNGGQQGGQQGAPGNSAGQQSGGQDGAGNTQIATDSGSTNLHQPGAPGHEQSDQIGKQTGFVRVYGQTTIDSRGAQEKIASRINPLGGPAAGTAEVMGNADKVDLTVKNYADELPGARQRAMDDLTKQEIPPQYQDMIKAFYGQ